MTDNLRRLTVLYATETGNSHDVSKRIGREARSYGWHPVIQSLHVYDVLALQTEHTAIFVVATTGQGDVPDAMQTFWKFLLRKSLTGDALRGMDYAVFGLGDSAYVKFNVVAKKLHNRLASLGASAVLHRGLGDDQEAAGYEDALDPWLSELWSRLNGRHGLGRIPMEDGLGLCPFQVVIGEKSGFSGDSRDWFRDSISAAGQFHQMEGTAEKNASPLSSMDRPYFATVKSNDRLTSPGHFQDTRHLVLDIMGSGLEYEPGDVLAMHSLTPWPSVDTFLERIGIDPESTVIVQHAASTPSVSFVARSLVQGLLDIDGASPRRFFFEVLSHFATEAKEIDRLSFFASANGREELSLYCKQSGRTVLEVLTDFPSSRPTLEWILESCPRKLPRKFSIASSPQAFPNEIHLTVAIVAYMTKARRLKMGLCTSYLASLKPADADAVVPCWIEKGSIRLNHLQTASLILIGPGTGVAPFRSILHERLALQKNNIAFHPNPCLLFFGSRNRDGDFYYASEWKMFLDSGILDKDGLITAFSRDQEEKIYVTHRIKEDGGRICQWLMNEATVCIAGSANKMPSDVNQALEHVMMTHGQMSELEAQNFLRKLQSQGRYQVESWS